MVSCRMEKPGGRTGTQFFLPSTYNEKTERAELSEWAVEELSWFVRFFFKKTIIPILIPRVWVSK